MLHTGDPQSTLRMGDPQSMLRTGDPQSMLRTGDPQSELHTGDPQNVLHTGDPQSVLQTGDPQNVLHMGYPGLVSGSHSPSLGTWVFGRLGMALKIWKQLTHFLPTLNPSHLDQLCKISSKIKISGKKNDNRQPLINLSEPALLHRM